MRNGSEKKGTVKIDNTLIELMIIPERVGYKKNNVDENLICSWMLLLIKG